MQIRQAVCTAALAVPLLLAGAAPSAADVDVGFGIGSPYYGSPYWDDGYYGHGFYDHEYYRHGWGPGYYGLVVLRDAGRLRLLGHRDRRTIKCRLPGLSVH